MNTVLRESMDTIQNQTQKSSIEISIEDTEIENLDKKTKEVRQKKKKKKTTTKKQQKQPKKPPKQNNNNNNKKPNKTLKDKVEYAELNKLVKKKHRTRARRKGK